MRPRGFRSRRVWDLSHEFKKAGPGYGKIVKQGVANNSWHRGSGPADGYARWVDARDADFRASPGERPQADIGRARGGVDGPRLGGLGEGGEA